MILLWFDCHNPFNIPILLSRFVCRWLKNLRVLYTMDCHFRCLDGAKLSMVSIFRRSRQKKENWKIFHFLASESTVKLKFQVRGVSKTLCGNVYKLGFENKQLCAGGEQGVESCNGDSGGPLMFQNTDDPLKPFYYLVGIVSFGKTQCGTQGVPVVYTRVGEYVDWITRKTQQ